MEEKAKNKCINICQAINYLPDELITEEIYLAGIKEGDIKLLELLPQKYLTEENINHILDKNKSRYSWNSFSLESIPAMCRTEKICEDAVSKSRDNYLIVPEDKRTNQMLLHLMSSAEKYLHYLPMVPVSTWDDVAVFKGIQSIYSSGGSSSYNSRYSSGSSSDKSDQLKLIQILLYYVPEAIKSQSFYMGLFSTSMKVQHIDQLVPKKYKSNAYYLAIARKEIKQIPLNKLDYDTLIAGLLSDKNSLDDFYGDWRDKSAIKVPMLKLMDGVMADIIIRRDPCKFKDLPDSFQTKNRLILALDLSAKGSSVRDIYSGFNITKFDDDICRAIIRKDSECPEFAPAIWTQDFVDYCMEHGQCYNWFRKMPEKFQTQEMVDKVVEHGFSDLKYVRPEFVSYDIAVEAFRYDNGSSWGDRHPYREFVPSHYINDFILETGLPKEFFGGKVSYHQVREDRKNYTYSQIGDCFVGFFIDKDGHNTYNRLIMTRRSPMAIKPTVVFSRTVDTFHKTWFEKIIADSDPKFSKPALGTGFKQYQYSPYFDVKQHGVVSGQKIVVNTLLGEPLIYSVKIDSVVYNNTSVNGLTEFINKKLQEKADIAVAC